MEEEKILSAVEASEFGEFQRVKRETEIGLTLQKLVIDASRRETDKVTLKRQCEVTKKLRATGILVSPVNVAKARKQLQNYAVCCIVGGTGESIISVKKAEAKKAVRQGAKEIKLVLCYSALFSGNFSYLKREIKRVRRAAKKRTLIVSLEDHALTESEISLGVRAALAGKANGVSMHGQAEDVLRVVESTAGKLFVEASGVENAQQLRLLLKAGAVRFVTREGEKISEELYRVLSDSI